MKLLTRTSLGRNRYELTVEVDVAEGLGLAVGSITADFEGMGIVRVLGHRPVKPQSWLHPSERVISLEVETLETVGELPNI